MNNPLPFPSSDGTSSYLGQLAHVSLLTREGEIEIAKRIEAAEHSVLAALCLAQLKLRARDLGAFLEGRAES